MHLETETLAGPDDLLCHPSGRRFKAQKHALNPRLDSRLPEHLVGKLHPWRAHESEA